MDKTRLYEASMCWVPDFPRRATFGADANQTAIDSRLQLRDSLMQAAEEGGPGYTSVYSFPRGHSRDDNIPKVDTLFFDLDIPADEGSYNPREGGDIDAWRRDMSKLLVRARMVAQVIRDADLAEHVRVAYSGHKGIHLYVDFPELPTDLGPLVQYKNGLQEYADSLLDFLSAEAGVELGKWFDVSSHDLGRLARHPNTPHHGAAHTEWTPYCVPGSVDELASMDVNTYLDVTRGPRPLQDGGRSPSQRAHEVIVEHIKSASESSATINTGAGKRRNEDVLERYSEESNDNITIETVTELLVKNKPCINEWRNRDDAYQHGAASRQMEINVIKDLAKHDVPIDVMVDFFRPIPNFDEDYTRAIINDVIARYHPSAFVCRNVVNSAPDFCLDTECGIYRDADDLQK